MSQTIEHPVTEGATESIESDLKAQLSQLEQKVATLDRQLRGRNTTLACILHANGGSFKYPKKLHEKIMANCIGATFKTDTAGDDYVITGTLLHNKQP